MGWPWDVRDEYAHQLDLLRESIVARKEKLKEAERASDARMDPFEVGYDAWRAAEEAEYQLAAFDATYRLAARHQDSYDQGGFLREDWPPRG